MGPEPLIFAIWVIQVIVAAVLLIVAAFGRQKFAAGGLVLGLVIGFSPLALLPYIPGPHPLGLMFLVAILSGLVLLLAYGAAERWVSFTITLLVLAVPPVALFLIDRFLPGLKPVVSVLGIFVYSELFLGPLLCALVCREFLGRLDGRAARKESVA